MDFPFTQEQTLDILYKARDEVFNQGPDSEHTFTCLAVSRASELCGFAWFSQVRACYETLVKSAPDYGVSMPLCWNAAEASEILTERFDLLTLAIVIAETDFSDFVSLLPE